MFSIPLYIFLIAFALFLIIFILFSLANVYHIVSTSSYSAPVLLVTTITVAWCLGIMALTFIGTSEARWNANMVVLGSSDFISFE